MCQPLLRAHVVARKDVQPTEAAQQCIFSGPSADAPQCEQSFPDQIVVFMRKRLEIDLVPIDSPSQLEQRPHFLATETNRAAARGRQARHSVRAGKGMTRRAGFAGPSFADSGESIEQLKAYNQRQLLAGESVDQRFEQCRETWRLDTSKLAREQSQPRIAASQPIPRRKVNVKPKQAPEHGTNLPCATFVKGRREVHEQTRGVTRTHLPNSHFGRVPVQFN